MIRKEEAANELNSNKRTKSIIFRQWFIIVYVIICISWMFPLLGDFRSWFSWAFSILGAGLILWDIFTRRLIFRAQYWYLCIAFFFVCGISTLLNMNGGILPGLKQMLHTGIFLFILFMQNPDISEDDHLKQLKRLNHIVIGFAFAAALVSLLMFILNIGFTFEGDTAVYHVGFCENRLFGVYTSPNVGALFGIISVVAGCINSVIKTGKMFKWSKMYIANAILQLCYFVLSLSNGAYLSIAVLFFMISGVIIFKKLSEKRKKFISIVLSFACFVGSLGGLFAVTIGLQQLFPVVANATQGIIEHFISDDDNIFIDEDVELERIESGEDLSNGRITIWSGAAKLWLQQPLFGLSYADINDNPSRVEEKIKDAGLTDNEREWMEKVNGNMHNVYIQVLVYSGIVGLALFIVLILLILKRFMGYLYKKQWGTKQFLLIALIFCTIVMVFADGLVESHLLFNRQNAIASILWIYLGIGLVLIKKYKEGKRKQEGIGRHAFICETPFQALNEINFALNDADRDMKNADIFIYHQFASAEKISERLRGQRVFQDVIDVAPYLSKRTWHNKIRTLIRIILPIQTLNRYTKSKFNYNEKSYQYIVCCSYTLLTINLFEAFHSDVIFLEDGTGSYFGNIEKDYRSGLFNFFNRFFMNGALDYHPQRLCVNNPAICSATVADDIQPLPKLDENNPALKVIETVFDYRDNAAYGDKRIVYLTQPLNEVKGSIPGAHEALLGALQPYREDTIVRIHPRQKGTDTGGLAVDEVNNLWELECIRRITGRHILIAAFSTAQLAPKLLCDAEPYLIFAYKLFFTGLDSEYWQGTAALIEKLRGLYSQPEKIYIPENAEKFSAVLRRLTEKQ